MSEGVIVALIGAGQAITLGLIGWVSARVGRVKKDAAEANANSAATRAQVENDHSTNLREENDSRHAETKSWIDDLAGELRHVRRDVGGIRQELRDDRRANNEALHALDGRVTTLEKES